MLLEVSYVLLRNRGHMIRYCRCGIMQNSAVNVNISRWKMSFALILFLLILLFWIVFLQCRRLVNTILSWILCEVISRVFPDEDLQITVDDFGYLCVNGIHIKYNKKPIAKINQILLQLEWDESISGLKLQSTIKDVILERCYEEENECSSPFDESRVEIRGSITAGVNLFAFSRPTELLKIAPEAKSVHGAEYETSDLTSVWLFARNGEALMQKTNDKNDDGDTFYKLSIAEVNSLVLYNSRMTRLIFLFKNVIVTCSDGVNQATYASQLQVATSEGLELMYKFVDGVLTSSHSRLKHTEAELNPVTLSTLETLVSGYVKENTGQRQSEENALETRKENPCDKEESGSSESNKCEVAFEAESITTVFSYPEKSKHFELNVAFVGLGCPDQSMTKWSISIPFEVMFFNGETVVKDVVLGSKIKSEGLVNPCVLKAEGEENAGQFTKWDVSFNEEILVQIKPEYVNTLESFINLYRDVGRSRKVFFWEVGEKSSDSLQTDSTDNNSEVDCRRAAVRDAAGRGMFKISACICEIAFEVLDAHDQKLLQVVMLTPQLSIAQDVETRSFNFAIGTLKGFNCVQNIPFFHPTDATDEEQDNNIASLSLSVVEELSNDQNKVSFKSFVFGSCNTTVVAEETLIFAVMKHFGLHKKVAQIFFERQEENSSLQASSLPQRFYFDHLELRAVQVILTLLPAIDLPVELKIIKNDLGIPHQLPPRFENASLNFDEFVRNNIQYGSYKYISNDIKKHYLKELGSQSARVLGSMHLLGNISRLKQDIMSGFTTLRETGEFITFFRQVTTGVASSYSKFTGSWSDLFGLANSSRIVSESRRPLERRHSDPSDLDVTTLTQVCDKCTVQFQIGSTPLRKSKDDSTVSEVVEESESVWLNSSVVPDVANQTDSLNWDNESSSSDGEGSTLIPLDLIPRNVRRQLKGQEFLRRLKENLADNEHGEVFACCFKIRKNDQKSKLNALLSNRKVFFLRGRPSHESLVLCVKYEALYRAQYICKDQTHYLQLVNKMKGIRTLSIPSRNPSESPLVLCDNMVIARKVAFKINELKKAYDHEYMHSQH